MVVFPENMNRLDVEDVPGSLRSLETYIGYIRERVEFAMRGMTRNVENAGLSSVEVYILLSALQDQTQSLQSAVAGLGASLRTLEGRVAALEAPGPDGPGEEDI